MTRRTTYRTLTLLAALVVAAALGSQPARSADHLEAPFVTLDGRLDINDVYVFTAQNPDNTVMIMTVNPGAGVISGTDFHDGASYEFAIDKNEDTRTDLTFAANFGPLQSDGRQRVRVQSIAQGQPATTLATGFTGDDIQNGDVRFTTDVFDDPFFFDLNAFQGTDGRTFCDGDETDFFAGLNVAAIVLEVPKSLIDDPSYKVYGRIGLKGLQADRMGFPAINTVFIPQNPFEPDSPNVKDAFNATQPRGDQSIWRDEIENSLRLFHTDETVIDSIADILLPDLLPVDDAVPPGFDFLNGRQLADDVIDLELALLTNGAVDSDCVDENDVSLPASFPYLGSAQ